jgi:hypothetical protein
MSLNFPKSFFKPTYHWNEERQPYMEVKSQELYKDAISYEYSRICEFISDTPEVALNRIGNEIHSRLKISQNEIFNIGELLFSAKKICRQNQIGFKEWIKKNFEMSYETANNFMNVYKQCLGMREVAEKMPPSILYRISKPSFPDELREYLYDHGNIEKITNGNIDALLKKYREGDFCFSAIEKEVDAINQKYKVFRQTHKNLEAFEKARNTLSSLKELFNFNSTTYEYEDWNNPEGMEPEALEINTKLFHALSDSIMRMEEVIESSNEILKNCDEKIREIQLE